ncbi:MAG: lipopolysaccharide biosynthesis protein [Pseudomonadota bacterium]|nr:lipopolysaccharide biosynthesis protein [Pseudomonadota bacterium]
MSKDLFEPRHKEMARHVTSGIFNSGIVQIVKTACQFASVIVLSRLLSPSDFGLIAMTGPVVGFLALFQDLGLNQATVQKPDLEHEEVNAFFWINTGAGLLLALILIAISPLVGVYYNEPRVVVLTAAVGFQVFISGLGNQQSAILQRRMEFGVLAKTGTLGAVTGLLTAIIWAMVFKNYWAIYAGSVVGTVIPIIGVWRASGWMPTRPRRVPGLGHMLSFGAGITSFNVSSFIARNTDNLLIGRSWGNNELGLYDRAYKLLLFPLQRIIDPMTGVMVPVLSRLTEEPERYRSIFVRALSQLTLATWPGIVCATVLADPMIPTLLGKNWADAVPMFVPLAFAGLLQVVNGHASWLFISQGRAGEYARFGMINAITSVISFLIGLPYGGVGVATAYSVREYLLTPFLWWYVTRTGPVQYANVIKAIVPQVVSVAVAGAALLGLKRAMPDSNPWFLLIVGGVLSYSLVALTMLLFAEGRETLKQSIGLVHRTLMHLIGKRDNTQSPS